MDINSFALGYSAGKKKGGGGTPEGFHMVRFYNDDRTTLLYTVFVPTGASAMYAGETPTSTIDSSMVLAGFNPSPENVTEDMDCFAVYESGTLTLDSATWEEISRLSANGEAQNYFSVGDTKMIHIEGTVGTLAVNGDYGVYILGFDHNEALEGKGIHFGTFKSAVSNGIDLGLDDSYYSDASIENGTKCFNMNHWGSVNYGGWAGSDVRYDILGSTDNAPSGYGATATTSRKGNGPSSSCATNPVPNTLMAALPADLRAVMKPMTKYTDNTGNKSTSKANVTATIDYLPLLSEFESLGAEKNGNTYEKEMQKAYDYCTSGNSLKKYRTSDNTKVVAWLTRTPDRFNGVYYSARSGETSLLAISSGTAKALAPIFKV